jgi:polyphosphate kinase
MVRVAALKHSGEDADPSGFRSSELLEKILAKIRSIIRRQYDTLMNEVIPGLAKGGLSLIRPKEWSVSQRNYLESFYAREVFPLLTPLRVLENENLPAIDSYSLYAAFLLEPECNPAEFHSAELYSGELHSAECISIIRIPKMPERIVFLPEGSGIQEDEMGQAYFALLEDLIETWGSYLYNGYKVRESLVFKVNRDADFSVDEQRDEDFIEAMEEVLEGRERSMPVRMLYSQGSKKIRDYIAKRLSLEEDDLFEAQGPLSLEKLYELIRGFDHLKEKPWKV